MRSIIIPVSSKNNNSSELAMLFRTTSRFSNFNITTNSNAGPSCGCGCYTARPSAPPRAPTRLGSWSTYGSVSSPYERVYYVIARLNDIFNRRTESPEAVLGTTFRYDLHHLPRAFSKLLLAYLTANFLSLFIFCGHSF